MKSERQHTQADLIGAGKHRDEVVIPPGDAQAEIVLPLPPLKLQANVEPGDATSYSLHDLLGYHDRAFVEQVYAALLKRNPTKTEVEHNLTELRSGRLNKIDIIEALLDSQRDGEPAVRVEGLPSRTLRRLGRWPVLGYVLRVLRGLVRLPVIMRDQQRFEAYSLAQQQRIADYLNEELAPAVQRLNLLKSDGELTANIKDAVESVIMLSESQVDLSERQSALEEKFERIEAQLGLLQSNQQELQAHVVALGEALKAQQQEMERLRNESSVNAAAQREFLIQEQRMIVEAQKVALKDLEEELDGNQDKKLEELAIIVHHLQQTITPGSTIAPQRLTGEESDES